MAGCSFRPAEGVSKTDLAIFIFNAACEYDSIFGVNAHLKYREAFDKWLYKMLKQANLIDDDETQSIKRVEGDFSGDLDDYPDADVKFVKRGSQIWKMYGKSRPPPDYWERYEHLGIRVPDMPPIKDPTVLPPWLPEPPPGDWKPGRGKPGSPGNPEPLPINPGPVYRPPDLPW